VTAVTLEVARVLKDKLHCVNLSAIGLCTQRSHALKITNDKMKIYRNRNAREENEFFLNSDILGVFPGQPFQLGNNGVHSEHFK